MLANSYSSATLCHRRRLTHAIPPTRFSPPPQKAGCGVSGEGDVAGDAPRLRADAVIGAAGGGSGGGKVGKSGGEKRSVKRPATAASAAGGSGGGQKDGVVVVRQKKKKRKKARITVEEDGR